MRELWGVLLEGLEMGVSVLWDTPSVEERTDDETKFRLIMEWIGY